MRFESSFLLIVLLLITFCGYAQGKYVYTIKADSVKITNCDSAELIIENHTQNIPGFLFNTGNGRTIFKRGLQKLNDSLYLIGADTLKTVSNAWLQGGNSWQTTGILGTLDNNHLDLYTNNTPQARLTSTGNLLLGTTADYGYKMQITGAGAGGGGGLFFQPNLSVSGDRIRFGGYINTGDGQEQAISLSTDSGRTFSNVMAVRGGFIGLGPAGSSAGWYTIGTLRINSDGTVSIASPSWYFGNIGGGYNASSLITYVSNPNEWNQGLGNYPSGQNYYYFGTTLQTPEAGNKRAPLRITADQLHFMTGATSDTECGMFSEAGNLLLGATTDNGTGKLQVTGNVTATGAVQFSGLTGDSTQTRILVSDVNGNLYYRSASSLAATDVIRSSLAVNGPISAHRLTLSRPDWPDYVFDSTYHLPSLTETEDYIHRQHHLPGIPSAAEVEKKGIEVGETQAALLKKIEELTLYTIQQDREIETIKKEMAELRELIMSKSQK